MEYRGFECTVVQSIFPKRYRWSVKRDLIEKAGISDTREAALSCAKQFIDRLIKTRLKPTE